jgi:hypothetical protein
MFSPISEQPKKDYKFMTEEQFEEIVDAVLAGKYSWACVLILRAGGYNPVHYIPYRTYNRLIKQNCLGKRKVDQQEVKPSPKLAKGELSDQQQGLREQIENLSYIEKVNHKQEKVSGGWRVPNWIQQWF